MAPHELQADAELGLARHLLKLGDVVREVEADLAGEGGSSAGAAGGRCAEGAAAGGMAPALPVSIARAA